MGDIMREHNVDYNALRLIDEPPGKLWGVEITLPEQGQPRTVYLEIERSQELFSETRTWPRALVERQKIIKIHTSSRELF